MRDAEEQNGVLSVADSTLSGLQANRKHSIRQYSIRQSPFSDMNSAPLRQLMGLAVAVESKEFVREKDHRVLGLQRGV